MIALTDRYIWLARVLPVAVACAPVAIVASAWVPFPEVPYRLLGSGGLAATLGILLGQPARTAGKALEQRLWAQWNGPPTVRMLRHRDPTIDPGTKARIHGRLVELGVIPAMPSKSEEDAQPEEADAVYKTCSTWLRNRALQLKATPPFDVVHSENIGYGFARNMLGIKPSAVGVLVVAMLVLGGACWAGRHEVGALAIELTLLAGCAAYLTLWVNENAVRKAADNYAERLLGAIDGLPLPTRNGGQSRTSSTAKRRAARPVSGEAQ